jgi:cellulose synthase/poly-beta-1,6-N-acetylglucosamine synthase-like glycosyltransferase
MKLFTLGMEVLFWVSLSLIIYTYFLYPAILFVVYCLAQLRSDWRHLVRGKDRRVASLAEDAFPQISFVIPAYNEEAYLPQKVANLRELDYPPEKLQIIFVSDGSTDSTNSILASLADANIETHILQQRSGKAAALNRAVQMARNDILVFSDASTLFAADALQKLARHFADPRIGAVCGALQFHQNAGSQHTEGIYWRYECMMRLMEARLGATLTASGAIYALRRQAYVPLDAASILDDFISPMNARKAGYAVAFDPEAKAIDFGPENLDGEFARRVRIATGSFRSLMFFLRVKTDAFVQFAFISHKLLRWFLPVFLCVVLISNATLARYPIYAAMGMLQLFFYLWAGLGFFFRKRLQGVRFAMLAYYLLAMNFAFLLGLFRFFTNQYEAGWDRAT